MSVLMSSIMQLYSVEAVKEIVEAFKKEVLADTSMEVEEIIFQQNKQELIEDNSKLEQKVQKAVVRDIEVPSRINMLLDVMLDLTVVFGSTRKTISELLSFGEGSVIELEKYIDEPLEIFVNNKLIGFGEVVVVDENFGIRITSLVDVEDRIQ